MICVYIYSVKCNCESIATLKRVKSSILLEYNVEIFINFSLLLSFVDANEQVKGNE